MFGVDVPDLGSTRVSLSQDQTLDGSYHFTTLNVPAGSPWTKVFSHDISGGYFSNDDQALNSNPGDPSALLFSILGTVENFRDSSGNFRFRLCYPHLKGIGGKSCNEWIQSSNPVTSSTITGFKPVSLAFDQHFTKAKWQGLGLNEEAHRSNTLIDESPGHGSWFSAIGAKSNWINIGDKLPGPYINPHKTESPTTNVELYVSSHGGFSGDIIYNYEDRDQSLYGMCGKLLLSSITDTQTFTKARSFNHLDATTGVTTGISDTESVQVGSDNFNIKDLYDSSYKLDEDNTITSADFQIQDELTVSSNMEVSGTVETVDVLALASDIVIAAAEDLVITAPDGTRDIVIDEIFLITNNKLLATFPEWGKTFQVAFELRIRSFKADWTELLRFTSTENGGGGSPGDRIPAVFVLGDVIGVVTQIGNNPEAFNRFKVNSKTWLNVEMQQYQVENEWFFEVMIDGSSVWKVKNSNPTLLNNVKVWAAKDQYLPIADAAIRNFVADAGSTVTVSSNSHPISVPGKKIFTQPLTVTGDITTSGHLVVSADGIDRTFTSEDSTIGITNRILRKTGAAQTVSTNIELNGNVKIDDDLQADSIDGVDFSSISAKYEYTAGENSIPITANNLLATIPNWGPTFAVTFQLWLESFSPSGGVWSELLRFTSTEINCCSPGDRSPAIFVNKGQHQQL